MKKSKPILRVPAYLAAALLTQGCVSATFVQTGIPYPPKAGDCELAVFSSALPDRAYEELGIVEGEGDLWKADLEDILPRLREEACLVGGDALIMQSNNTFSEGREGTRVQRITATVIRWVAG